MPTQPYHDAAGKRLPGCTTVCGHIDGSPEGLLKWANKQGLAGLSLDDARGAADIGTWTHAACESALRGEEYEWPEAASNACTCHPELADRKEHPMLDHCEQGLQNFRRWLQQSAPDVIAIEEPMVSERHRFGGTLDYVLRIGGKVCLVDLKTGSLYPKHLAQLAGYGILWSENHPESAIDQYHLIRVSKEDGGIHWSSWSAFDMATPTQAFLAARQIYDLVGALRRMK